MVEEKRTHTIKLPKGHRLISHEREYDYTTGHWIYVVHTVREEDINIIIERVKDD